MKKTKSKPRKRKKPATHAELFEAATKRLESFPQAQSDEARAASIAAKALMLQAGELQRRAIENGGTFPPAPLKHWIDNLNRLIGMLCDPVQLEHVIAFESDCGGCGGTHSYVLSFAKTNAEMQRMLELAVRTVKPDADPQPTAAADTPDIFGIVMPDDGGTGTLN